MGTPEKGAEEIFHHMKNERAKIADRENRSRENKAGKMDAKKRAGMSSSSL